MKTSESIASIAAALVKAQTAIKFALADKTNPHLKSKYADLPSVIDAVKVELNEAGIMFMQTPGLMLDMHLQLTTRLIHSSGEWIEETMSMPLVKQDPQSYGSSLTYARRYSLAAITGLYQDDDDGYAASNHAKVAEEKKPLPPLPAQRFNKAIEQINIGKYTTKELRELWNLTPEQIAEVEVIEKAATNVPNPS